MLGGYSKGDEGNRMDFSVYNAPDAWNGWDASSDGWQSLYFGGVDPIIAATQLYNRFGANVFAMLLVLKKTETYLLVGDTPADFTIYPVLNKDKVVSQLTVFGRDVSENIRLEESEYQKTVQLERLLQTSRYLSSSLDVIEVLTRISTEAKEILTSYGTTIYLLAEDGRTLVPKVVIDPIYEEEILNTPLDIDNSYTGKAVKAK